MGKLSALISTSYGFTVEAASALSHPPSNTQKSSAPHTSNYGYYSRSHNLPLYQQPNSHLSSQDRRELPLPVIIPQRRPQNKSRGWARAYAPELMSAGISEDVFLEFLDEFNEESKASPYLHVVNVAGAGVGFLPGITPMIVSMAVPVAVQAAKKAQSNHQTESYLDKMNKKLFVPHGLYAIVMTYNPQQSGDTLNVDMSSNAPDNQFQSSYRPSSTYQPNGSEFKQTQEFTLPDSCTLIFADPAPPQTLDPSRNGFFKMADFVSDFKDRRAQASFAQENPTSTLVGPKPAFTSKYADPGYSSTSTERDGSRRRQGSKRDEEKENKKPGMLKGLKQKVMHSDVLYLMIVNNPSDEGVSSPGLGPGPSSSSRTHNPQYRPQPQQQYPPVESYPTRGIQYNSQSVYQYQQTNNRQFQPPSTYQYGPPPSRPSSSQIQYPQQYPTAQVVYSPKQEYNIPMNSEKQYAYEKRNENQQVRGEQRDRLAAPRSGQNENEQRHQQTSPVEKESVAAPPPVYTPYPRDEWDEWE